MHSNDYEVAELLVFAAVIFITLYPRALLEDRTFFGGDFSRPFRKSIFFLFSIRVFRWVALPDFRDVSVNEIRQFDGSSRIAVYVYFALCSFDGFGLGFLCLLLPYLLQTRLRGRTQIRPGQNLIPWLLITFGLHSIGAIGRTSLSPECGQLNA